MILGIDPGTVCGMANFEEGELTQLWSCSSVQMLMYVDRANLKHVVIEDSRLQTVVWNASGKNRAPAMKVARSVGSVDRICGQIEEICVARDIPLLMLSPRDKGSKVRAEAFREITGWQERTNEHQRDACMVCWPYRRMA